MGVFEKYLIENGGKNHLLQERKDNAAEFLQHAFRSMIEEGQDPRQVYEKAFPIFGEEFLIEAEVLEVVTGKEQING